MGNNGTSSHPRDHGLTHYRTRTRWGPGLGPGQPALDAPSRKRLAVVAAAASSPLDTSACLSVPSIANA